MGYTKWCVRDSALHCRSIWSQVVSFYILSGLRHRSLSAYSHPRKHGPAVGKHGKYRSDRKQSLSSESYTRVQASAVRSACSAVGAESRRPGGSVGVAGRGEEAKVVGGSVRGQGAPRAPTRHNAIEARSHAGAWSILGVASSTRNSHRTAVVCVVAQHARAHRQNITLFPLPHFP